MDMPRVQDHGKDETIAFDGLQNGTRDSRVWRGGLASPHRELPCGKARPAGPELSKYAAHHRVSLSTCRSPASGSPQSIVIGIRVFDARRASRSGRRYAVVSQ